MDRRQFLATMSAVAAKLSVGGVSVGAGAGCDDGAISPEPTPDPPPPEPPPEPPEVPDDVFQLGVASGDPLHDRVILWTRLAPDPLAGGGMPAVDVPVIWEVFADPELTERVRHGWAWATPAFAHSVHVDAAGLEPERFYWYRFRIGDAQVSPVGRTRTFPAPGSRPERLRVALACCQRYRDGFFTAHAHLADTDLDAVLFVGDYVYESGGQTTVPGRLPIDTTLITDLAGFRARYGGYRMDPDLQASHAAHPWIIIWDDHEVSNNYAGFQLSAPRRGDGDPVEIRAAGYQAWYEHTPIRVAPPEDPAYLDIYRRFDFGDLATLYALDTRQYRDPQPCDDTVGAPCEELLEGGLSILGAEQRDWLLGGLAAAETHWNVIVQQVMFSPVLMEIGAANPDGWDGYLDDRQALLDAMAEARSPMVLSGDVHVAGFGELHRDQHDPTSPRVAIEVVTTSITSGGDGAAGLAAFASIAEDLSDTIHYIDAARRGFAVCDYTREACEVTYYVVSTVRAPTAELGVSARFRVAAGSLDVELLERDPA